MTPRLLYILYVSVVFSTFTPPFALGAEDNGGSSLQQISGEERLVQERILTELRLIKREISLLKQQAEEPGLEELIAGVGYIFGLFGAAALAASRRKKDKHTE